MHYYTWQQKHLGNSMIYQLEKGTSSSFNGLSIYNVVILIKSYHLIRKISIKNEYNQLAILLMN